MTSPRLTAAVVALLVVAHCAPRLAPAPRVVRRTAQATAPPRVVAHAPSPGPAHTALSLGAHHACAVRPGGALWCWGDGTHGQLGVVPRYSGEHPVDPFRDRVAPTLVASLRDVTQVSAEWDRTCALRADGTVHCAGSELAPPSHEAAAPSLVAGLARVVALASGPHVTCARQGDGRVLCFGDAPAPGHTAAQWECRPGAPSRGALERCRAAPEEVPGLRGVVEIAVGGEFLCGRGDDGAVRCLGRNDNGELGDGTMQRADAPVPVRGLAGARALAAGYDHACALREGGAVVCWGNNADGQLGDGTTQRRAEPVAVAGLTDAVSVAAEYHHTCALRANGAVLCWGRDTSTRAPVLAPTEVRGLSGAAAIALGSGVLCAVDRDDRVRCLGDNRHGQLGDHRMWRSALEPTTAALPEPAVALAAHRDWACAIGRSGRVRCWGGASSNRRDEYLSTPTEVPGVEGAEALAVGDVTCARQRDGRTLCWRMEDLLAASAGGGTGVAAREVPALAGASRLWSFGDDARCGQVGTDVRCVDAATGRALARPLSYRRAGLRDVRDLASNGATRCGLTASGEVGCEGQRLVAYTEEDRAWIDYFRGYESVADLRGATRLAMGYAFVCGLGADARARCRGEYFLIGSQVRPVDISDVADLAAGITHACAALRDGTVRCWGYSPDDDAPTAPQAVPGVRDVAQLAAGMDFTCARRRDGAVLCWGDRRARGDGIAGGPDDQSAAPVALELRAPTP